MTPSTGDDCPPAVTFHLHRAERADRLAHELGVLLATPLADPFATEVVAVPTQGVERWLAQTLSHRLGTSPGGRDGVCAGVDFSSPRRLVADAVASVSGIDTAADPWLPARMVWPLLEIIDRARGEAWARLLWSYLGDRPRPAGDHPQGCVGSDPVRRGRRWATAAHVAELFASYASSRPGMILSWSQGRDVDGNAEPLPDDYRWQPELWRRLRSEVAAPSPAERFQDACRRLAEEPALSHLPARLSVFGVTRLHAAHRAVFAALARHRDVHLWLAHPSPALWQRLAQTAPPPQAGHDQGRRAGPAREAVAHLPAHRLLGYLGRDSRELQLTLAATAGDVVEHYHAAATGVRGAPATLLEQLQADIAVDRGHRPESDRPLLDPADRSVSVHASHGPDRQVEVLRDVLVGLLADDDSLEPRDIVVMCPDIETFAPLISASFGLHGQDQAAEHPGHRLRVRLADRALRQVNPLLAALDRVLGLTESRMEASTLLDLCAFSPVAQRFALSEDDLERLGDLVHRSGVRWGLDPEHRQAFAMGQFGQNTWAAGVDRLLLGVAMDESDHRFLGTALPLDDVDSSDVDLVGRLAELVERVRMLLHEFATPRPVTGWVQLCKRAIELLTAVSPAQEWQRAHAYAQLAGLDDPHVVAGQAELSVADVRAMLADTFRGRATRANFRTGTLTMCTMLPMRSVPHRVICLLGIDDGVFPRSGARDGDDILATQPEIGDRDPRSEDRQLLLDAILAAEERLVVIYSGVDARTRAAKPPAVPVGALLDALDGTARTGDGRRVRDHIVTVHPLQPHDPANFTSARPDGAGHPVFSFDRSALRGARSATGPRQPATGRFDADGLSPVVLPDVVALPDLVRFFAHPLRALLRERAGLRAPGSEDETDEQVPLLLTSLESWDVGSRLLVLHLQGADIERLTAAEWRRGSLPPRQFGRRALAPVVDNVRQIASTASPFLAEPRNSVDVLAELGEHAVAGTLSTVHGDQLVTVNYSWLGARHRLQAWVELLALTVTHPDRRWRAVSIGRGQPSMLGPVPAGWAARVLADLLDLYRTGLSEPLPLGPKTASEYARIRRQGKSVPLFLDKLNQLWNEERDPAYERLLGARVSFEQVLQTPSHPEEERGSLGEPSRFGTLARRVWHPLLESEELR